MTITISTPQQSPQKPASNVLALVSLLGLALAMPVAMPVAAVAQEASVVPDSAEAVSPDSVASSPGVSPSGAFLRAVLLPGWGHSSIGSYTRGGFYFTAEVTTGWGLLRTIRRLAETRQRITFREDVLLAEKADLGITDPDEIKAALDGDEVLEDLNDLLAAREDQQEDWAALGIFLLFLAGADAFVSAHLADFPTPITIDVQPLPGGRVELSVGVRLPNP